MVSGAPDHVLKVWIERALGFTQKIPVYEVAPVQGRYHATPPTLSDGEFSAALMDQNARLIVKAILDATSPTINVDVIDRADRLLGKVYGSQAQPLQQRATTFDLLAQLRHNGVEIDPRDIRALTSSTDSVMITPSDWAKDRTAANNYHSVRLTDGTAFIDPRDRNWSLSTTERTPLGSEGVPLQQVPTTHELKVREQGTPTVNAQQAGTWNIGSVGSITNPVTVQATDLDIRDITETLTADVTDRDARLLGRAKVLDSAGTVINPARKEDVEATQPRNIAQWGGVALTGRDISLDLAELSKKYTYREAYSGSVAVNANSYVDWLSVSGTGKLLTLSYHYSAGIPAIDALAAQFLDGYIEHIISVPSLRHLSFFGYNGVGTYTAGSKGFRINTWNTASNVYDVWRMGECYPSAFKTSLVARLQNYNPTLNSTQTAAVHYQLFTASKIIYAKMVSQAEIHSPSVLKAKLSAANIRTYAVVMQILGYYVDERTLPPLMREFSKDLPNEWDDERVLPDGSRVRGRRPNKAHQTIEIHVDEGVSTDDVIKIIKPAKFLKEEVI